MTKAQEKAIEYIKREAFKRFTYGRPQVYEWKRFDVSALDCCHICVIGVIGRAGDEGTLAEVFARNKFMIFVGPRGGLSAINNRGVHIYGRKAWSACLS